MRVEILPDAEAIGRRAADLVAVELGRGDLRVLGVATGSSPSPIYESLRRMRLTGWQDVQVFALDEYIGLGPGHPQSYRSVIDCDIGRPLGIPAERVHVPDGDATDLVAACSSYERELCEQGGVDVQILGIGVSGHIGFNEPGSSLTSRTREVSLTEQTRTDNARFFATADDVPRRALTQGIATIAQARKHVLVARGAHKAAVVRAALEGEVSTACPASAMQRFADLTVLLDPAAAAGLVRGRVQV